MDEQNTSKGVIFVVKADTIIQLINADHIDFTVDFLPTVL